MTALRTVLPWLTWILAGALLPAQEDASGLPAPELSVLVDVGALGEGGAQPPLSLWSQPAATASREQVARQLSLLLHGQLPPSTPFAAGFRSFSLAVVQAALGDPDHRLARYALVVRHDQAAALASALGEGAEVAAGAFHGRLWNHRFVGSQGDQLAIGDTDLIAQEPPLSVPGQAHPPLSASFEFAPVLALCRQLETVGVSYNLDPLLPRWRQDSPLLLLSAAPSPAGWTGTVKLQAQALPLHAIAPQLARLCLGGHQLRLALGVEPRVVTQLIDNFLALADERQLETRLGMSLEDAGRCFTGDAVLVADAKGIIPQGCLALGLRPQGAGKLLAAHLAGMWNGSLPDQAKLSWNLTTGLGPFQLVLQPGCLLIANDPAALARMQEEADAAPPATAGGGGDANAGVPAGDCAFLACDLPAIAGQWLPVLWPLLAQQHLRLAGDPMRVIAAELPAAAGALLDAEGQQARLSELVASPGPVLMLQRGGNTIQWTPPPHLVVALRQVLGAAPAPQLDQLVSGYADAHIKPTAISALFVHLPDGMHELVHHQRGREHPLSPDELVSISDGLAHVLGPEPAQLAVLTPPPVATLDASCLPDPGALARALLPYRLEVRVDAHGATASEGGEPLAAAAALVSVSYLALVEQPHMLLYLQHFSGQIPPAGETPAGHKLVEF